MVASLPDEQVYIEVYTAYFPKLVRFSRSYVLSPEDAENIVQDVFVYLWEHRDLCRTSPHLPAFLFTAVKNRCLDYLRKETYLQTKKKSLTDIQEKELEFKLYALQALDEKDVAMADMEKALEEAIARLPARCREIFILSRLEGVKQKEIAERLSISVHTVEGQMAIAWQKLRYELRRIVFYFLLAMLTQV